jgi:hypothetical protein
MVITGLIWEKCEMPKLNDYVQFQGLHWETGSLRNYLDYQGVIAPHTGKPYSEAMLLGISGGITMSYFSFAYQGYDPWVRILTRNTFDPLRTIYERLDIQSNVRQTTNPEKGVINLLEVLEGGSPAIVFADMFSLPYNAAPRNEGIWLMFPILVYGYDQDEGVVWIADRSRTPLLITAEELAIARERTKKNKYRLLTHEPPNANKLASAVEAGIRDCIQLFSEPPPKGSAHNFGFLAFDKWAEMLSESKSRSSWEKVFPPGAKMYTGLTSVLNDISIFGKDGGAEREVYAEFLEEASIVLAKPAMKDVAEEFRASAAAWDDLVVSHFPDEIPLFEETRRLMLAKHHLFLEKGNSALAEIHGINDRLAEIKDQVSEDFPLDGVQIHRLKESVIEKIMVIRDSEYDAIQELDRAIG